MLLFHSTKLRRRKIALVKPTQIHHTVLRVAGFLALMCVLHVWAMWQFEGLALFDGFWLTATTLFTVGYGDLSAKTVLGRLSTIVLIYGAGIFILATWVGKFTEWREYVRERKRCGQWRWNMLDHIVVIGTPEAEAEFFFNKLVQQVRNSREVHQQGVLLLTQAFANSTPDSLLAQDAVHYRGTGIHPGDLDACGLGDAIGVIVLADHVSDLASDSKTLDLVGQIRDRGFKGNIAVECVNDANRKRLELAGASAVVRPMRGYPEMLVRCLVSPGCEDILENLFTSDGDELVRVDLPRAVALTWGDIACRVIQSDVGIPVGYLDMDGRVKTNPRASERILASTLFVVLHERVADPAGVIDSVLA